MKKNEKRKNAMYRNTAVQRITTLFKPKQWSSSVQYVMCYSLQKPEKRDLTAQHKYKHHNAKQTKAA